MKNQQSGVADETVQCFNDKPQNATSKNEQSVEYPFRIINGYVEKYVTGKEGSRWVKLFSELKVVAQMRDEVSQNWSYLLLVKDPDGKQHEIDVAYAELHGTYNVLAQVRSKLAAAGLRFHDPKFSHALLPTYIEQTAPEKRLIRVNSTGWQKSKSFVTPDWEAKADPTLNYYFISDGVDNSEVFSRKNTHAIWKEKVADIISGNALLEFSICLALCAPLLEITGFSGFGAHFYGPSSCGKTTGLFLAASVWGNPCTYVGNWNATATALEGTASRHNNTILCLDEIGQANPDDVNDAVYMLANGQGKGRGTVKGGIQTRASWKLVLLSNGEVPFDNQLESGRNHKAKAGQKTRLLNIAADGGEEMGIVTHLPVGYKTPGEFVVELKARSCESYGTLGREFVEYIIDQGEDRIRQIAKQIDKSFVDANCDEKSDGQVKRVAANLGLVAAAGELAISARLLPWQPGTAINASRYAFKSWLKQRGGIEADEIIQGVKNVEAFLQRHGQSRFTGIEKRGERWVNSPVDESGRMPLPTRDCAGYRILNEYEKWEYLIFPDVFKKEVCNGIDCHVVAKKLANLGFLKTSNDGKLSILHRVPKANSKRFYYISADFVSVSDE